VQQSIGNVAGTIKSSFSQRLEREKRLREK
jgi:hypothetical protein